MEARDTFVFPSQTLWFVISHIQGGREGEVCPMPILWGRPINSISVTIQNIREELWFYNLSQDLKGIRMFLLMILEVKFFRISQENSLILRPGFLYSQAVGWCCPSGHEPSHTHLVSCLVNVLEFVCVCYPGCLSGLHRFLWQPESSWLVYIPSCFWDKIGMVADVLLFPLSLQAFHKYLWFVPGAELRSGKCKVSVKPSSTPGTSTD